MMEKVLLNGKNTDASNEAWGCKWKQHLLGKTCLDFGGWDMIVDGLGFLRQDNITWLDYYFFKQEIVNNSNHLGMFLF